MFNDVHPQLYGIDREETSGDEDDPEGINVPTTFNPLLPSELQSLQAAIQPLQES